VLANRSRWPNLHLAQPESARARSAAHEAGFYAKSGSQIEPEIPAAAILDIVTLSPEAQIDLVELRGAPPQIQMTEETK